MEVTPALILLETLSFIAEAVVVFAGVALTAIVIITVARRGKAPEPRLEVRALNERYQRIADALRARVMEPRAFKKLRKKTAKARKAALRPERNIYVLRFKGDILASAVDALREEVTGILAVAGEGDEVLVLLESPGGVVHTYGLAASQLMRLRQAGVRLVVSVDKVAASGGYMMACVADEILAAPFAVLGSIGVAAPLPNVHRLLRDHGVDYEDVTAGEYKRTVSLFGEISAKGRAKFQEQIEDVHVLFKEFIRDNRPDLDIDAVATGEHWYGTRALELGLANRLQTSDDYLLQNLASANLYAVSYKKPKSLRDRLAGGTAAVLERAITAVWSRLAAPGV